MAVCVGCGLIVDGATGLLQAHLKTGGHLACSDADGISVDVASLVSADACNGIRVTADKLYSPCPKAIVGTSAVQNSPQSVSLPISVTNGGNYNFANDNSATSIHICNTTCCTVEGLVFVDVGGIYIEAHPGFIGNSHLQVKVNSGAFGDIQPSSRDTFTNTDAAGNEFHDFHMAANLFVSLAAGQCVDYQWNLVVDVQTSGSSVLKTDGTLQFVTRWSLSQTGCGC